MSHAKFKIFQTSGSSQDFSKGVSHFVKPRVLSRLACRHPRRVLLKVTVFFFRMSSDRGGRGEPTIKSGPRNMNYVLCVSMASYSRCEKDGIC